MNSIHYIISICNSYIIEKKEAEHYSFGFKYELFEFIITRRIALKE